MPSRRDARGASQNGGSNRKRSHPESDEEDETQFTQFQLGMLDTSQAPSACTGVVHRLYLRNFMCHNALEVLFNPRVNFVVGRNGSGKSAILLALVVGLGGKASATNRGSSLKDFVKKGEKSAVIEVTLHNDGFYKYKADLYGTSITVVRTIVASGAGGGYKIKSHSGSVVTTKREDLVNLLEALKIQVDNPIAVLNQDTSRNFLNSSDASDKYTLFMRATQMDVVNAEHERAIVTRAQACAALKVKAEVMHQQEKSVSALRARCKALKSVPEQRQRIESLENQICWAQVVDKEAELAAAEAKVAEESRKRDKLQREIDGLGTQDTEMNDRHKSLKMQLEEKRSRVAEERARLQAALTALKARQDVTNAAKQDLRQHEVQVKRQQDNVAALRTEIERLEQSTGPDYVARRAELRQRTVRCVEQLEQANAATQTSELHYNQLRENEGPLRDQLHALRVERGTAQRNVENLERELESLSSSDGALSLYGKMTGPLQKSINAAVKRGEFSCPPVGPLGMHVKMKDGCEKWTGAVEQQLGGMLRAYLVNSAQDRATLFKLIEGVIRDQKKPTVINSRFQKQRHNVGPNCVAAPKGTRALLDVITIDNVHAFNALVDGTQMEKILLIESQEQAFAMMKRANTVPRNCGRGVLPNGDLFYPAPDYRTYAGQRGYTPRYLQVSAAERIREVTAKLAPARDRRDANNKRVTELEKRSAELGNEIRLAREECSRLKRTTQRIKTELETLRDAEEPEVSSIATLAAELVECEEQLKVVRLAEQASKKRLAAVKAETDAAKAAARDLGESTKKLESEEAPLVEEMERIRGDLSESGASRRYREDRLRQQDAVLKAAQKAARIMETATQKLVDDASQVTPRVQPTASVTVLNEERRRLEAALRSLEQDNGNYLEVSTQYQELKAKFDSIKVKVEANSALVKKLSGVIKRRAGIYENVRRLISWVVTHYFDLRLQQRKYTGNLTIDHEAKKLMIEVVPGHRGEGETSKDTRTLSGGERSYSTVVFIMALWDSVELPFYFMDEFDVFMDKVNRKVIMNMLMEHAKMRVGRQFVFLTPQDIASVASDKHVSIYRMEDPRA